MEDYKEKYQMALEGLHEILSSGQESIKMSQLQLRLQGFFPELKYDDDEQTRRNLLTMFKTALPDVFNRYGMDKNDAVAWVEKMKDCVPKQAVADAYLRGRNDAENKHKYALNVLESFNIDRIEEGKYYYCVEDYYGWDGHKEASKGDVIQAEKGMRLTVEGAKSNLYFIPVNSIKSANGETDCKRLWHDANETPTGEGHDEILVQFKDESTYVAEIDDFEFIVNHTRWAYVKDLIAKN